MTELKQREFNEVDNEVDQVDQVDNEVDNIEDEETQTEEREQIECDTNNNKHQIEELYEFKDFEKLANRIKYSLIVLCILLFGFIITMKLSCN